MVTKSWTKKHTHTCTSWAMIFIFRNHHHQHRHHQFMQHTMTRHHIAISTKLCFNFLFAFHFVFNILFCTLFDTLLNFIYSSVRCTYLIFDIYIYIFIYLFVSQRHRENKTFSVQKRTASNCYTIRFFFLLNMLSSLSSCVACAMCCCYFVFYLVLFYSVPFFIFSSLFYPLHIVAIPPWSLSIPKDRRWLRVRIR